jgi:hypothetical protein
MSRVRRSSLPVLTLLALISVLFFAEQFGRDTRLFREVLTGPRVAVFASLAKMAPQLLGAIFAALCARRHEKGSETRRGWLLMSAWLGTWFLGQSVLSTYQNVLRVPAPLPSLGDLFFTLGYVCVIVALFRFAAAYRASGFAVGSAREHALLALGACAVFGVAAWFVLVPVAFGTTPLGERLVNVGYPLLDLIALIPALVLFRITIGFHGGKVWPAWGALLAGIVFAMGGDLVFSDISPAHVEAIGPLADLLFILGYSFCGFGMRLQYELAAD